ncbi:hypothetical protein N9H39_09720 [Gammaproteobacteria bacterium]|nr:hypothetical protein [Gammaproteobacteria bacterium]
MSKNTVVSLQGREQISDSLTQMLRSGAHKLIEQATEALAWEENSFRNAGGDLLRVCFSAIVTTAELKICKHEPDEIDTASGNITDMNFETVPFVRFRKTLSTYGGSNTETKSLRKVAIEMQRTVFVINSTAFVDVLDR